jgi:hypothetical protein
MSSFVNVIPEAMATASSDLTGIGRVISEANTAAAVPTTQVLAAADDEVSAAIASLFSSHGQDFQALSAQVSAFHTEFVQTLSGAAGSYASAEAANASPLQAVEQQMLGVINAPTEAVLGRGLIGNGTNGASGTGHNGGPGGFLWGNGGNGGSGATGQAGGAGGAGGVDR